MGRFIHRVLRAVSWRFWWVLLRSRGRGHLRVDSSAKILSSENVNLSSDASLAIGARTVIDRGSVLSVKGKLEIGSDCYFSVGTVIGVEECVTISDSVAVGPYCVILDTNKQYMHADALRSGRKSAAVSIGPNSWLGSHVVILPGTELGEHTVVAAGAVVRGKFPAHVLLGGVPAKVIKTLESQPLEPEL
jgi:acetyltransferase-like isoleucine patch superfamily enzyme